MNKIFCLFLAVAAFSGCSLDYSKATVPENLAETVPETVLSRITQVRVRGGEISNVMEADKSETYTNSRKTILSKFHLLEMDSQGARVTEGWAEEAVFFTDTENADISGDVYFYSETEKTAIQADKLYWDHGADALSSPGEETVLVIKENGSYIEGTGFQTDFRLKEISFSGKVNGKYFSDEDENNADEESSGRAD